MSIDLTLTRIRTLLSHLPPYTRPTCHIAGTNGKGSVSSFVASILLSSSPPLKVGRFNSPHLVSVYDSIVINNEPVESSDYSIVREFVDTADRVHEVGASSFELLTATALLIFERAGVDVVVMEVGMGGRLDATNVIPDECVLVSALTAVDLDHQTFLGNTVAEIAREKAAIVRKGRPLVLVPQKDITIDDAVRDIVGKAGGDLLYAKAATPREWNGTLDGPGPLPTSLAPSSFQAPSPRPVEITVPCFSEPVCALLPLHGDHQLTNLGLACSVVSALLTHPSSNPHSSLQFKDRITAATMARGILSTSWPGRLSFHIVETQNQPARQLTVLADGAHNPASATTLASYISSLFSSLPVFHQPLPSPTRPRTVFLTYILALSDSPPKTPLQTLTPLFPPSIAHEPADVQLRVHVAVLRFTPPEGMPWIKSVAPSELQRIASSLMADVEIWCPSDDEDPNNGQLQRALEWAASKTYPKSDDDGESLIVLAGSLYLVADFYRLIGNERTAEKSFAL